MFWTPRDAPAVVSLVAPIPAPGLASTVLDAATIAARRDTSGLLFLRLKTGELIVVRPDDLRLPIAVLLPIDGRWPARLAAAGRLRARLLGGRLPADPLTRQQRRRIALALRALDAREANAVLRAIAEQLYGAERVRGEHWKTSALKSQVARLVAHGRLLTDHGYRALLLGRRPIRRKPRGD